MNSLYQLHAPRLFPNHPNRIKEIKSTADLNTGVVLGVFICSFCRWLESSLVKIHPEPLDSLSPENLAHNVNILIQLLSESGLTSALEFDSSDILCDKTDQSKNLTKICLLTVHLWMKLHTRNCSAVRNFTGKLGPGKHCFKLLDADELITIKPKDSRVIKIQAGSRMMGAQESILFINMVGKKNGPPFTMTDILTGSAPVSTESFSFCLRIEPEFIQPTEVFEFSADLYSCLEIDVPVKCPFTVNNANMRNFDVRLFPDLPEPESAIPVKISNAKISNTRISNTNTRLFTGEGFSGGDHDKLTSFYFKHASDGKMNLPDQLNLEFIPFTKELQSCYVLFTNAQAGIQFTIKIQVSVNEPKLDRLPVSNIETCSPLEHISLSEATSNFNIMQTASNKDVELYQSSHFFIKNVTSAKTPTTVTFKLNNLNAPMESALKQAAQKYMTDLEIQRRALTSTLNSGVVAASALKSSFCQALGINPSRLASKRPGAIVLDDVTVDNTESFTVKKLLSGEIELSFNGIEPGQYSTNILAKVARNDGFLQTEVRKYRVIVFVLNPEAKDEKVLKFQAPAFSKQTRYLVFNNEKNPESIELEVNVDGQWWDAPSSIVLKPYQLGRVPVTARSKKCLRP